MDIYEEIKSGKSKISIIGLGYVGIHLLTAFAKKVQVIGFDINKEKIDKYKSGIDVTMEVGNDAVRNTTAIFTADEEKIGEAKFHIIAVPTPVDSSKIPDLSYVIEASRIVGRNITEGDVVVYESTTYPGMTEEICIPILEEESNRKCGGDFKVGYSPERINPGDKHHNIEEVMKVVAGMDNETLETIANVYAMIIDKGIYRVQSIKVAEACKIIENTQRDINIALMNELSIIFNKMGIDTKDVINAASTKWNFVNFRPGLVGGHCIGVDPYYLTYKAKEIGYHPEIILAGRRINDYMGKYVAENTLKMLIKADKRIKDAKITIMGVTYKGNCPDVRNSKVIDIIDELKEYKLDVKITDPIANPKYVKAMYSINLNNIDEIKDTDVVIFTVDHDLYRSMSLEEIKQICSDENPVLIDIRRIFDKKEAEDLGLLYWSL